MKKAMGAQTSFLFFLVSHIKIAKVEKVESLTRRTEKKSTMRDDLSRPG